VSSPDSSGAEAPISVVLNVGPEGPTP
jgi:hypothetical protein